MTPHQHYQLLLDLATIEFPHLVADVHMVGGTRLNPKKARIVFQDDSFLDIWLSDEDYAYHWEHRAQDGRRHRWDNAPHHPHVTTHPHHFHDGGEDQVVDSSIPVGDPIKALRYVLLFVDAFIQDR